MGGNLLQTAQEMLRIALLFSSIHTQVAVWNKAYQLCDRGGNAQIFAIKNTLAFMRCVRTESGDSACDRAATNTQFSADEKQTVSNNPQM